MAFKKGQSGNPSGRPKGSTKANKYREMLESESEELINKTLELAKEGHSSALLICMERLIPKLKPMSPGVNIGRLTGPLSKQGQTIISAMGKGVIATDEAQKMLSALASQAKIIEVDELIARIEMLEKNSDN